MGEEKKYSIELTKTEVIQILTFYNRDLGTWRLSTEDKAIRNKFLAFWQRIQFLH